MRLTKSIIDKLPLPDLSQRQVIYRDTEFKGFAIRITHTGVKSFVVEKRIGRKNRRITLGPYGPLTVEQARKEAMKVLGKMATGIDPILEDRADKARQVTLLQAFTDYLTAHWLSRKHLKNWRLYSLERT